MRIVSLPRHRPLARRLSSERVSSQFFQSALCDALSVPHPEPNQPVRNLIAEATWDIDLSIVGQT
jgi:hypothetical protein